MFSSTSSFISRTSLWNETGQQQAIMREIRKKPFVTASELSEMLGISLRKTQENMRKLRETGLIRRIGPDKGGHWEVIDQQP